MFAYLLNDFQIVSNSALFVIPVSLILHLHMHDVQFIDLRDVSQEVSQRHLAIYQSVRSVAFILTWLGTLANETTHVERLGETVSYSPSTLLLY